MKAYWRSGGIAPLNQTRQKSDYKRAFTKRIMLIHLNKKLIRIRWDSLFVAKQDKCDLCTELP